MASQGPLYAGRVRSVSVGLSTWQNPTNAQGSPDGNYSDNTLAPAASSDLLWFDQYGFSIPPGATIDGLEFVLTRVQDMVAGADIQDAEVRAVKVGTRSTTELGAGASWATPPGTEDVTFGGSSDLCGESWSASDINDSGTGFAAKVTNGGGIGTGVAKGYAVALTVYYTPAPTSPVVEARRRPRCPVYYRPYPVRIKVLLPGDPLPAVPIPPRLRPRPYTRWHVRTPRTAVVAGQVVVPVRIRSRIDRRAYPVQRNRYVPLPAAPPQLVPARPRRWVARVNYPVPRCRLPMLAPLPIASAPVVPTRSWQRQTLRAYPAMRARFVPLPIAPAPVVFARRRNWVARVNYPIVRRAYLAVPGATLPLAGRMRVRQTLRPYPVLRARFVPLPVAPAAVVPTRRRNWVARVAMPISRLRYLPVPGATLPLAGRVRLRAWRQYVPVPRARYVPAPIVTAAVIVATRRVPWRHLVAWRRPARPLCQSLSVSQNVVVTNRRVVR